MWAVSGHEIKMTEGDYGIKLPITISGTTLTENDVIKFTLKDKLNGSVIIENDYSNIVQNTVNLELTAAESALLPVGDYVYSLDWYQGGTFMCNIIAIGKYKVVEKA